MVIFISKIYIFSVSKGKGEWSNQINYGNVLNGVTYESLNGFWLAIEQLYKMVFILRMKEINGDIKKFNYFLLAHNEGIARRFESFTNIMSIII